MFVGEYVRIFVISVYVCMYLYVRADMFVYLWVYALLCVFLYVFCVHICMYFVIEFV